MINSFSQDLRLLVKKGNAYVSEQPVPAGKLVLIKSSDNVRIPPNTLSLVQNNGAIAELSPGKSYSYADLLLFFKSKKNFIISFFDVILNQDFSRKQQTASTTRGNNRRDDDLSFSPKDSVYILSDSITLKAGSGFSELISDIKLYRVGSNDTLFFSKQSNAHRVALKVPGIYLWEYRLQYGLDKILFVNTFSVPDNREKAELLHSYMDYKKAIKEFSVPMQEQLIYEYMQLKKVHIN